MEKGIKGVTALGFGLEEYAQMFGLTENEKGLRILDCRAGASCFAAQMHHLGNHVIACDPLYQHPFETIQTLVLGAKAQIQASLETDSEQFSILQEKAQHFLAIADEGVQVFFEDFPTGKAEHRYMPDALPDLSFGDETFELALVCHYLFTFSDQLTVEDHIMAIKELVRVANEVRIFPLVTYQGVLSPFVGEVVARLQQDNLSVEIRGVDYQLQNQGNAMLRVWSPACSVEAHQSQL